MRSFALPLLLALGTPASVLAQAMVQPLPGSTDADLLAATMRRVAANPNDVDALLTAGEQSLKVDDLSGAAALFARADKIDPRSGRAKAGEASILVRSERPGEALRYFQQAEGFGLDARRFAADRGLAYDLIGQQERAQRDYRLALATARDDETVRRYALSLGISGRRDEALALLDPLLGRTDRAAWRARAFILAMAGDQTGAERIAATMMPGGMARQLLPFFQRLPQLGAVDRAFAVHFGEVRATPERIADAQLTPPLPALIAERPVQVAAARTPVTTAAPVRESRRDRRRREAAERAAQVASARAAARPGRVAMADPAPLPAGAAVAAQPPAPTALASNQQPARPASVQQPAGPTQPAITVARPAVQPSPPAPVQVASANPARIASPTPAVPVVAAAASNPLPPATTGGLTPLPVRTPASPSATVAAARPSARPAARPPVRSGSGDAVLARIIASLSIPASELGVTGPARPAAPLADAGSRTQEAAAAKIARDAAIEAAAERITPSGGSRKLAAAKKGATKGEVEEASDIVENKPIDRRAAARLAAQKKAEAAQKKADAAKKLAADRKEAEERRVAKANPSRIWVQVAGGATESDLPKAWAATKAKAPGSFAGKSGYTTKLRATNRVLAGPFKTDAEARSFVNELTKKGIGAFPFTSDAGQAVTRLPSK